MGRSPIWDFLLGVVAIMVVIQVVEGLLRPYMWMLVLSVCICMIGGVGYYIYKLSRR